MPGQPFEKFTDEQEIEIELGDLSSEPKADEDDFGETLKQEEEEQQDIDIGEERGEIEEESALFPLAPCTLLQLEEEGEEFVVPPWGYLYILLFIGAHIILFLFMVILIIIIYGADGIGETISALEILFFLCFPWVLYAGMPIALSYLQANGPIKDFGITFRLSDLGWGVAYGLLCVACGYLAVFLTYLVFGDFEAAVGGLEPENTFAEIVLFLAIAVGAPIVEELLFRGFLFSILAKGELHYILVIIIDGLAFSLFHMEPVRIFVLFVSGSIFTTARVHTKSITPCMIAHGLNNLVAVILVLIVEANSKKSTRFLLLGR